MPIITLLLYPDLGQAVNCALAELQTLYLLFQKKKIQVLQKENVNLA